MVSKKHNKAGMPASSFENLIMLSAAWCVKHLIDKTCSCKYCQMIDVMFGDPLLNRWEKDFVESVALFGWHADYTSKQKNVVKKLFEKQRRKYVGSRF